MNTEASISLALDGVVPGTRLAEDVRAGDGQVLLTAGTVLTEAALEKLAARGIATLAVARPCDEVELQAAREALELRLRQLFRHCDLEHPDAAARQLFEAVLAHRLEDIR
ncbi:MAG: hypothetical protein HZB40_18990 [Rhodocyclales bacterium]|nr:hypothetical protein [Rhodocyclales bacterium]